MKTTEKQTFVNEITAHFNLRKRNTERPTNLYMVINVDGKQIKIPTGVKVHPHHWNGKKQMPLVSAALSENDNRNNGIIIKTLKQMKQGFNDFKEHLNDNPNDIERAKDLAVKIISPKAKKAAVVMPMAVLRKCIMQSLTIKDSTKQQHISSVKVFEQFLNDRHISLTSFDMVTLDLITDYQTWLQTEYINPKGKNNAVCTINKQVRGLKSLFNVFLVPQYMSKSTVEDVFSIKQLKNKVDRRSNEIALRDDEIMQLYNYKPTTVQDEQIRDMFVLNCLTGQRISDLAKLDLHIDNSLGFDTVSVVQQKTDTKVEFEFVFELARQILMDKYNGTIPIKEHLDRLIRNNIQRIAREAGICGTVTKQEQRGSDTSTKVITMERWQCIKTHTARRTFISLLKIRGWDDTRIMNYSGHRDEKMVDYYCKLTNKDRAAFARLQRNSPEMVLRFVEDYTTEPTTQATTVAVPSNLGEEIRIGSSIYVWVHCCERLNKIAELFERVYHFEKIDEVQGDYQLLKFTEDYTR